MVSPSPSEAEAESAGVRLWKCAPLAGEMGFEFLACGSGSDLNSYRLLPGARPFGPEDPQDFDGIHNLSHDKQPQEGHALPPMPETKAHNQPTDQTDRRN